MSTLARLRIYRERESSFLMQGQARGYGHITLNECFPKRANTSNSNNSKVAEYFYELLSLYENLEYLRLLAVGFMHRCILVLKWWHFEKKFSKICFPSWVEKWDFLKNLKNYSTLTMRCDQTTWPTANQKVLVERQCPYLSFGTLGFQIGPPAGSQ